MGIIYSRTHQYYSRANPFRESKPEVAKDGLQQVIAGAGKLFQALEGGIKQVIEGSTGQWQVIAGPSGQWQVLPSGGEFLYDYFGVDLVGVSVLFQVLKCGSQLLQVLAGIVALFYKFFSWILIYKFSQESFKVTVPHMVICALQV